LNRILGKDQLQEVVVVGMGNIGRALLCYGGLEKSGIKIAAGFDIDPAKLDPQGQPPVLALDDLVGVVKERGIVLGVLAVPDYAAQQVLELMLSAGIRGVLNFAPICLKAPEGCTVNNINLESELENLIYFVNASKNEK
jgi:redox-sensing transcriptional repressor